MTADMSLHYNISHETVMKAEVYCVYNTHKKDYKKMTKKKITKNNYSKVCHVYD